MAELSSSDKAKKAAELISQIPPGEVNDVINGMLREAILVKDAGADIRGFNQLMVDIRAIINDDEALMPHVTPALRAYNLAQLHVVEHQGTEEVPAHSSLLSEAASLPSGGDERYIDAEGKRSFAYDHATNAVSSYEPYELPQEEEALRADLAKSLKAYCKNHFSTGASSVNCSQYPLLPPPPPQASAESTQPLASSSSAAAQASEPESTEMAVDPPVTDVVEEQVGSGKDEPAPTPAVGDVEAKVEEVVAPGGLEKVDEDLKEVKEEEEGGAGLAEAGSAEEGTKTAEVSETPVVTEVVVESGQNEQDDLKAEGAGEAAFLIPSAETETKQERIENPVYTLEIVGNRYNPSNFWTGRWRTRWIVDQAAAKVTGTINVDVHYYEQGNVQLATNHSASFPLPTETTSQSLASQIVTTLSKIETAYHMELNDVYGDLGDKAFRSLRRALPVTRQKMDWEKVQGYNLGSDLTKARG